MESFIEIFILTIVSVCLVVNAQNACKTPVGEVGKCVAIETCSIHLNILTNAPKPLSQSHMNYLKKSHCGSNKGVHYVCCAGRHIQEGPGNSNVQNSNDGSNTMSDRTDPESVADHPSTRLINAPNCGRIAEDKLSNGNHTAVGEFPWVVQLLYNTPSGLTPQCGASLISKRYVLTAAHCVTRLRNPLVAVRLGEHDTSKDVDCISEDDCMPPVQDIRIEEVRAHPEYNKPKFANDIAVLRLKQDAIINGESVLPICLPATDALRNGPLGQVTIAGWGLTETNTPAHILQKAVIPVLTNKDCQLIYKRNVQITTSQMCAGGLPGVDSCKGDSGGPLFYTGRVRTVRYVQYGIVSFGLAECGGTETYPGIYARVTFYMKWILDQLKP